MINWPSLTFPALNLWNYPDWVQRYPDKEHTASLGDKKPSYKQLTAYIHGTTIKYTNRETA